MKVWQAVRTTRRYHDLNFLLDVMAWPENDRQRQGNRFKKYLTITIQFHNDDVVCDIECRYTRSFNITQGLAGWDGNLATELAKQGFTGQNIFCLPISVIINCSSATGIRLY